MKIGILYNFVDILERGIELDKIAENESLSVVDHIYAALGDFHEVIPLRISPAILTDIASANFDMIFNVCEGIGGNVAAEALVPAVLEVLGIPYTGSDHLTLALCLDKARTKQLLIANGIPTPNYVIAPNNEDISINELGFPLIVKPLKEDGSIGITSQSVVMDDSHLYHQIKKIHDQYKQPALVEDYIEGREINIALFGNESNLKILPASEILFDYDASIPHIVDYESKWVEESATYKLSYANCPADIDEELLNRLSSISKKAFKITGCRDYARIDFRVSDSGVFVLEVNPNPGINIDSGYVRSAQVNGWTYKDLIFNILNLAFKRYGRQFPITQESQQKIQPYYQSSRLDYYPVTYSHIDDLFSWFNNHSINRYMADPEAYVSKDKLITDFLLHPANSASTGIALMVYDRSSQIPIGYGAIYDTSLWNQTAEISYLIGDTKFSHMGYGTEIVQTLVFIATEILHFYRLEATVTEKNLASWNILEKVGFRRIGKRTHAHLLNGYRYDDFIYEYIHTDESL